MLNPQIGEEREEEEEGYDNEFEEEDGKPNCSYLFLFVLLCLYGVVCIFDFV
jgi:hypothetical protein